MQHFIKCLDLLLKSGANSEAKENLDGTTPLGLAAENGYEKCVKLLFKSGANADAQDNKRLTPLQLATAQGHTKCVEALLKAGVKIEKGRNGHALFQAASKRFHKIFQLLEKHGEGVGNLITDEIGQTALHNLAQIDIYRSI